MSFYGKHLKWFCFPTAETLLPPFPSRGGPDPAGPGVFYRELCRGVNSEDIKKHPSEGSSCSGKPGESLHLKPECGLGKGRRERGEGCEETKAAGQGPCPRREREPAFNSQSE